MAEDVVWSLKRISDEFTLLGKVLIVQFAPAVIQAAEWIRWAQNRISQTGFGAGTMYEGIRQRAMARGAEGAGFWETMIGGIKDVFTGAAWEDFSSGVNSLAADQQEISDQLAIAARRLAQGSGAAAGTSPFYNMDANKGKGRGAKPHSDALLAVGNFMGASRNGMIQIQRQHFQEAQKHTRILEEIRDDNRDDGEDGF